MSRKIDHDFEDFLHSLPIRGGARTRIHNCLFADGITSFDKLLSKTDLELLRLPMMGRVFVLVLAKALADRGLSLAAHLLTRPGERCPTCGQILLKPAKQDAADE
jgi:hypothetical protein